MASTKYDSVRFHYFSRGIFVTSVVLGLALFGLASSAFAVEHVLLSVDGYERELSGKIIVEDSVGNMLLATDEGGLWPIAADTVVKRNRDQDEMVPLDKAQLTQRLLREMGNGFQKHETTHYVIVHNTTRVYARWCGSLLERLQKGFLAFWKKRGAKVRAPTTPLSVLIFNSKASYLRHAKAELGAAAGSAIGYYSLQTNRIVMYDLTGSQELRRESSRRGSMKDITALLQHPEAQPLVATIIHEATHQISYNCGLQTRYVDNPIWVSEGMAVYFETPNLSSNRLWSGTDKVNYARWDRFRKNVREGKAASLKTLISDDNRLRHPRTAVDGYAEAWAWNYFLIKWHPKKYSKYLEAIAEQPLLVAAQGAELRQQRLEDFQAHFGENLADLEDEFIRRMSKIK